jgi:hypothetical protein
MKFLQKNVRKISGTIFTLCLFVSVIKLQTIYDEIVHPQLNFDPTIVKYVTPSFMINGFSFGFRNVLADFYWISLIQDFPGWNHRALFYTEEYDNLFTLDPKFSYPYLFAILTIPSATKRNAQEVEKAEKFAVIGIKNLPYNWEIPFYLGTQFNLVKAKEQALYYIGIAASRPIIPDIVLHAYTSMSTRQLSNEKASRELIQTIYNTTESKTTKKIIKEGMVISQLTKELEDVVKEYKNKYGTYPTSLDDIVSHGLAQVSPALEKEFNVIFDAKTGAVYIKSKGN